MLSEGSRTGDVPTTLIGTVDGTTQRQIGDTLRLAAGLDFGLYPLTGDP